MSVAVVVSCSQIGAGQTFKGKLGSVCASPDRLGLGTDPQFFVYFQNIVDQELVRLDLFQHIKVGVFNL